MVNLTIDGKKVQVAEGTNLIDAAESAGIHIPNLCYLKGMKGIGACRMCLVEIEGMKAPMIGCTTRVKEGMAVTTKTEKIEEVRKFVIDLILSMHPLDCMTCTKAGVCNLQNYAYEFEIKESSFTRKKFGFAVDEANPFIKRDPDYCILCGRCIRVCKDQGTNVLEFMGRGVGSKVSTANDLPLQESGCTFCGSCVDVCPVNALLEADRWKKGREWDYDSVKSVCLLCGNGCDIKVSTKDGRIMKINAGAASGSTERYICAYGRFGYDCIEVDTRVTSPMKRINGELKETTWDDALGIVANALKQAGKDAGFISTAGVLNEDALTLKKLASDVVKTKNVDSTASLYGDADTLISGSADLETADVFVLVDLNPSQWERVLPAIDAVVRRRVNAGAKLVVINSSEPKIASIAAVNLIENEAEALRSLAKALMDKGLSADKKLASAVSGASVSEAVEKAASLMMDAKNPVILSSPAMYPAAANIALLKGAVVSVPVESNAKGVVMMGLITEGKSYKEMTSGGMDLLYAIGEVPLNKRPHSDFLVVQNSHMTELAKQADVVLPSAAYLEADGTIVDYLGRLRHVCKAVEPAGDSKMHREIFAGIAKAMGKDMKEVKESEVKKLTKVKPKVSFSPFERKEGFDVKADEMIESINASVINGSRLLWLREPARVTA
ncbi:MAG: molybdopterin-dependent oxidoreductase [Thermodesulfovibrionales bacterium]|nr:molybdopterin-dependent oxidoreductase [Thermodesulfovibrionales bacterium]